MLKGCPVVSARLQLLSHLSGGPCSQPRMPRAAGPTVAPTLPEPTLSRAARASLSCRGAQSGSVGLGVLAWVIR